MRLAPYRLALMDHADDLTYADRAELLSGESNLSFHTAPLPPGYRTYSYLGVVEGDRLLLSVPVASLVEPP